MKPRLRTWLRRVGIAVAGLAGLAVVAAWTVGARIGDHTQNGLAADGPYGVPPEDRALVADAGVVDLHADALLWRRDLASRGPGHVDLPRLFEADVVLQVFGLVTKVPWRQNFASNPSDSDGLGLLAWMNHWPPGTWRSVHERALFQSQALRDYAAADDRIVFVRTGADLSAVIDRRAAGEQVLGVMLGLEGMHALEGDLGNLDRLWDAGLRMGGLAHFFDNEAAGSAHGVEQHGLSEFGRRVVERMQTLGMVVDLAHASPATVDDVLAMARGPVVVSHGGVQATCPGPRTLTDQQVRGIAATGGVIGIAYFSEAVCDTSPEGIADAIAHVVDLVGPEHVALGSDYDGGVDVQFDPTGIGLLVQPLRDRGLDDDAIRAVLVDNALRVLLEVLPAGG